MSKFVVVFILLYCYSCCDERSQRTNKINSELPPNSRNENLLIQNTIQKDSASAPIESTYLRYESFDINYDNFEDLVLYFDGPGSIHQRVKIYYYDSIHHKFILNEKLSLELSNPSFFMKRKLITSFNIGPSGGEAAKYIWNGTDWMPFEDMNFEYHSSDTWAVKIFRLKSHESAIEHWPFNVVPDTQLLPNVY